MINRNFLKEMARDFIALGSPIFFIIIIARISLLSNYSYLSQFIIAGILFTIFVFWFKVNLYSGLGLILLIFVTLFYNNLNFTIFGIFIYILLLASLVYLNKNKKEVLLGIILGLISSGISYYVVKLIFSS